MASLKVNTQPLVPKGKPYPPGTGNAAEAVIRRGGSDAEPVAAAFTNIQASLNLLHSVLRNQSPVVDKIAVVDSTGKVIAAIGDFIFNGVPSTNYFSEIHVGDPLNTGDPSQALFNANTDGSVTIGQNGWLDVLDPFDADAAWIGTQFDVFNVTGAVAGAASGTVNLIRLTVTGHTLLTGDVVQVRKVVGVTNATDGTSNANGTWTVTKIDANHVDLQNSVFVGTYTSGGTIDRLLHVTGAANNGSGLIRLTVTAHGYETGDKVDIQVVGGVPNATGQWIITVIDANHFDLDASTFAGAYTSGGTSLRYFAGGLFQTIAIGPSFVNYKLRAFADGTLKIQGAEIILNGSGAIITLDPDTGTITIAGKLSTDYTTVLNDAGISITSNTSSPQFVANFNAKQIECGTTSFPFAPGYFRYRSDIGAGGPSLAIVNNLSGAINQLTYLSDGRLEISGASPPTYSQFRSIVGGANGSASISTLAGDNSAVGFDSDYESSVWLARNASVAWIQKASAQLQFQSSAGNIVNSAAAKTTRSLMDCATGFWRFGGNTAPVFAVDVTGDCNVSGLYRVGGFAGLTVTRSFGTSVSVGTISNAIMGTPGVGQSNFTAVTSVALNTNSNTFAGGILTV